MKTPLVFIILVSFIVTSLIGPLPQARADGFYLPAPGVMVHLSPEFNSPILKGIKVHPDNPFLFDFILDKGDEYSSHPEQLKEESTKLIKYFLASLTIPEKDLWVNLSPYEKDRIIPRSFGLTEMGRDLLAEDYMLKQITASLIYPEDAIGKKFWRRVYEEAQKKFGTTNIPVNTFNKVWIVPDKAVVYENAQAGTAYVVESKLKVMLEQDYLSLSRHVSLRGGEADEAISKRTTKNDINALGSQIVREIVIPELTKEVNEGKNFAQLRQVYNSLILAAWYKKKIRDSILEQIYTDKNKIAGVGYKNSSPEAIYQRYLQAFKKGVYNYIKEEQDPITQATIPRKYFSGGFFGAAIDSAMSINSDPKILQLIKKWMGMLRIRASLGISKSDGVEHEIPQVAIPSSTPRIISKPKYLPPERPAQENIIRNFSYHPLKRFTRVFFEAVRNGTAMDPMDPRYYSLNIKEIIQRALEKSPTLRAEVQIPPIPTISWITFFKFYRDVYMASKENVNSSDPTQIINEAIRLLDQAMASPDAVDQVINRLRNEESVKAAINKRVDPRELTILIVHKVLIKFVAPVASRLQTVSIDGDILKDFIKAMDRAKNPLVENRRSDYVYNLLVHAVSEKKGDVWGRWLEVARSESEQRAIENIEENEKYAVTPDRLRSRLGFKSGLKFFSPVTIVMDDDYALNISRSKGNFEINSITCRIVERRTNKNAGIIDLGWDKNTSSWVVIAPHGIQLNNSYRDQGLGQRAFFKLINMLGVIRAGITPDEISPFAQRMCERIGSELKKPNRLLVKAEIGFTGYYPIERKEFRTITGWSFIFRSGIHSSAQSGTENQAMLNPSEMLRHFKNIRSMLDSDPVEALLSFVISDDDLDSAISLVYKGQFAKEFKPSGYGLSESHMGSIFNVLSIRHGEKVLEVGPGEEHFGLVAALLGADVTIVETPQYAKYSNLASKIEMLSREITNRGGKIELIEGDIIDPEFRMKVSARSGTGTFDHIIALDVLRPNPYIVNIHGVDRTTLLKDEQGHPLDEKGNRLDIKPSSYVGITTEAQVQEVVDWLLLLKNFHSGILYYSHPDNTTERLREIPQFKKGLEARNINITFESDMPIPRSKGLILRIGKLLSFDDRISQKAAEAKKVLDAQIRKIESITPLAPQSSDDDQAMVTLKSRTDDYLARLERELRFKVGDEREKPLEEARRNVKYLHDLVEQEGIANFPSILRKMGKGGRLEGDLRPEQSEAFDILLKERKRKNSIIKNFEPDQVVFIEPHSFIGDLFSFNNIAGKFLGINNEGGQFILINDSFTEPRNIVQVLVHEFIHERFHQGKIIAEQNGHGFTHRLFNEALTEDLEQNFMDDLGQRIPGMAQESNPRVPEIALLESIFGKPQQSSYEPERDLLKLLLRVKGARSAMLEFLTTGNMEPLRQLYPDTDFWDKFVRIVEQTNPTRKKELLFMLRFALKKAPALERLKLCAQAIALRANLLINGDFSRVDALELLVNEYPRGLPDSIRTEEDLRRLMIVLAKNYFKTSGLNVEVSFDEEIYPEDLELFWPNEAKAPDNGGIDFTPAKLNLQTRHAGEAIKFRLDPAMLEQLQNAPGFVPAIIDIQPMNNLREFLGIAEVKNSIE